MNEPMKRAASMFHVKHARRKSFRIQLTTQCILVPLKDEIASTTRICQWVRSQPTFNAWPCADPRITIFLPSRIADLREPCRNSLGVQVFVSANDLGGMVQCSWC